MPHLVQFGEAQDTKMRLFVIIAAIATTSAVPVYGAAPELATTLSQPDATVISGDTAIEAAGTDDNDSGTVDMDALARIQSLALAASRQIRNEDLADPYLHLSLHLLQKHAEKIEAAKASLEHEESLFTGDVGLLPLKKDHQLTRMLNTVREASSRLSLLLATRSTHPSPADSKATAVARLAEDAKDGRMGSVLRALSERDLAHDLSGSPITFDDEAASLEQLLDKSALLDILRAANGKTHYEIGKAAGKKVEEAQVRTEATGEKTILSLAEAMKAAANTITQTAEKRARLRDERGEKVKAATAVWQGLETVLSMLDMHALRFGISPKNMLFVSTDDIERAHRQVETLRDLIIKEQTIRELQARMIPADA